MLVSMAVRAADLILRNSERRQHCPVADFELLIDVMQVHLDSAAGDIKPAPNFLIRQAFAHQSHDLALAVCQHRQHIRRDRNVSLIPRYGLIPAGQLLAIRDLPQ